MSIVVYLVNFRHKGQKIEDERQTSHYYHCAVLDSIQKIIIWNFKNKVHVLLQTLLEIIFISKNKIIIAYTILDKYKRIKKF